MVNGVEGGHQKPGAGFRVTILGGSILEHYVDQLETPAGDPVVPFQFTVREVMGVFYAEMDPPQIVVVEDVQGMFLVGAG